MPRCKSCGTGRASLVRGPALIFGVKAADRQSKSLPSCSPLLLACPQGRAYICTKPNTTWHPACARAIGRAVQSIRVTRLARGQLPPPLPDQIFVDLRLCTCSPPSLFGPVLLCFCAFFRLFLSSPVLLALSLERIVARRPRPLSTLAGFHTAGAWSSPLQPRRLSRCVSASLSLLLPLAFPFSLDRLSWPTPRLVPLGFSGVLTAWCAPATTGTSDSTIGDEPAAAAGETEV